MTSLAVRLINETKIQGLYVNCKLTDQSAADLYLTVAKNLPQEILHLAHEYHATICYDRNFVGSFEEANKVAAVVSPSETPRTAIIDDVVWWAGHDNEGYIVLKLKSSALQAIHRKWIDSGAKHSFEDYVPHVTIATGLDNPNETDMKYHFNNLRLHFRKNPITLTFEPETVTSIK